MSCDQDRHRGCGCTTLDPVAGGIALDRQIDAVSALRVMRQIETCRQDGGFCGGLSEQDSRRLLAELGQRRVSYLGRLGKHPDLLLLLCDGYQFVEPGECGTTLLSLDSDAQISGITVLRD